MFFLLRRFLVLSLSLSSSQKKNLYLPKLLEAHSQLNRGEQGVCPIRILYTFLLLKLEDTNCSSNYHHSSHSMIFAVGGRALRLIGQQLVWTEASWRFCSILGQERTWWHFCFLVKENKCGYWSLRTAPNQASNQKRTVLPLFGEQTAISLNLSKGSNWTFDLWRSLGVGI